MRFAVLSTALGAVVLPYAFAYFVAQVLNWAPSFDFRRERWLMPPIVIATALMAFVLRGSRCLRRAGPASVRI
jgi:hypothetical protein